jgi:hypothetical protein
MPDRTMTRAEWRARYAYTRRHQNRAAIWWIVEPAPGLAERNAAITNLNRAARYRRAGKPAMARLYLKG